MFFAIALEGCFLAGQTFHAHQQLRPPRTSDMKRGEACGLVALYTSTVFDLAQRAGLRPWSAHSRRRHSIMTHKLPSAFGYLFDVVDWFHEHGVAYGHFRDEHSAEKMRP
jgi:hypothetical protein